MKNLLNELRISIMALLVLALLTCGFYPVAVWAVSQVLFPEKANGSIVAVNGRVIGSTLIAQQFNDPKYFHARPSFAGSGYDAAKSGGSNLGPTSRKLNDLVVSRADDYRRQNDLDREFPVPMDAVTASGSGLDPHISVENALVQARRVAKNRGISEEKVAEVVRRSVEGPDLGLFGQSRVNVLRINLLMEGLK